MTSWIADAFYRNAGQMPEKLAIWCDGKTKTYGEMAELVSQYSHLLIKNGVQYGDHIAIPMNNSIESVALFFVAAELGVCLVPLNPTLPFGAIKVAMEAGDIKHLIARRSFLADCKKNGGIHLEGVTICLDGCVDDDRVIPFAEVEQMPTYRPTCLHEIDGNESMILTMTSGSTGNPKPIDLSQNNKWERAMAHVKVYDITSDDRVLAATPLYHSLAERLVMMPLMIGATTILLPRFTPKLWLDCVQNQQVTFTIAVSAQLAQILEVMKADETISIDSFRAIVSSSALLEEHVKLQLIEKLKCEFHEMYGTSETSTATNICFHGFDRLTNQKTIDKQKSVGLPFHTANIRILDDDCQDCLVGQVGEIAVKSDLTCKGYYKQEQMMAAVKHEGYFRTGDLGYMDEDGYLYFAGRKKELIITGAVNVYPNDIDAVVGKLEGVAECAAFSYPDDRLGEIVALAVVKEAESEITERKIQMYCARNLADFQQPHKIFFMDALPKNAMGKLQRMKIIDIL